MRKVAGISLCALILVVASAFPARAWHGGHRGFHDGFHRGFRSRVIIGVGPWWGPGFAWWGPPYAWGPWYAPYPYWWYGPGPYPYPSVVMEQPQMYIQQQAPPSPAPAKAGFWYYCASAGEFYPKVGSCSENWIKVPPRPEE